MLPIFRDNPGTVKRPTSRTVLFRANEMAKPGMTFQK